jgi:hypothetical protein
MKPNPDVLAKISIKATIQTMTQQIRGNIYVREWERVKHMMDNLQEKFLAITDVEISNLKGELVHRCNFLALNKDAIVWLEPYEEQGIPKGPIPHT